MSETLGLVFNQLKNNAHGLSDEELLNELSHIEGDTQRLAIDIAGLHSQSARSAYIALVAFLNDYQITIREELKSRMHKGHDDE